MSRPTFQDILEAYERIRPYAHNTPVMTSSALNALFGSKLYFKCENFQRAGAFKFRGATNTVFSLSGEEAAKGVVTHSSGNHAGALALAASMRNIPAYIVMPSNAPPVKIEAVKGYGGRITFCEPSLPSRESTAQKVIERTGAALVHPYDDDRILAGQGSCALELLKDVEDLDMLLVPLGGGGLLCGSAITARKLNPSITIIGVEPELADDAKRSIEAGGIIPSDYPDTIADGLRTSLSERTFSIIQDLVDDIILASEEAIVGAMRLIFERMKIVVEPSAVVPLAAMLSGFEGAKGRKAGLILSGGNVEMGAFFEQILS